MEIGRTYKRRTYGRNPLELKCIYQTDNHWISDNALGLKNVDRSFRYLKYIHMYWQSVFFYELCPQMDIWGAIKDQYTYRRLL